MPHAHVLRLICGMTLRLFKIFSMEAMRPEAFTPSDRFKPVNLFTNYFKKVEYDSSRDFKNFHARLAAIF